MDQGSEIFEELKELLHARFPDITCVRCGEASFTMETSPDCTSTHASVAWGAGGGAASSWRSTAFSCSSVPTLGH